MLHQNLVLRNAHMQVNRNTLQVTIIMSGWLCQDGGMLKGIRSLVTMLAYHPDPSYRGERKHHLTPSHNSGGAIKKPTQISFLHARFYLGLTAHLVQLRRLTTMAAFLDSEASPIPR